MMDFASEVGLTSTGKMFHKVLPPSGAWTRNYVHTPCHFGWPIGEQLTVADAIRRGLAPCSKCFPRGVRSWFFANRHKVINASVDVQPGSRDAATRSTR